jgi:hypothetical protein
MVDEVPIGAKLPQGIGLGGVICGVPAKKEEIAC